MERTKMDSVRNGGEVWRIGRLVRWGVGLALVLTLLAALVGTRRWPLVGDAPALHYAVFLIDHGMAPYKQVVDIEMPGTYALEWAAIHWLGAGDAGWRAADFGLLGVCLASMVAIAWPVDWMIGVFAGTLFALVHLRDGPANAGQRDLMMTALLLVATACLFVADRRGMEREGGWRRSLAAAGFGFFVGAATLIKPSGVLFGVVFAGLMLWRLIAAARPWASFLAWSVAGFALPIAAAAWWLTAHGGLGSFLEASRTVVAYHASLGRKPLAALVVGSFPTVLLLVAVPALPLLLVERRWKTWWAIVFVAGAVLGAASYVVQGKGFPYHRYPTEAFLLLLCGWLLLAGLQERGWQQWAATAGLLAGGLWLGPNCAWIACHFDWRNQEFNRMLQADLTTLQEPGVLGQGTGSLNGRVQCIDVTSGCLNTLYNMGLVQSTGYLSDCYALQPEQTPVSEAYRDGFMRAMQANPPEVLVVTDQECFSLRHSWKLPLRWPEFEAMLETQYRLVAQRTPPHRIGWWRHAVEPNSYRLYVRERP